jgi:hypothetical protein
MERARRLPDPTARAIFLARAPEVARTRELYMAWVGELQPAGSS